MEQNSWILVAAITDITDYQKQVPYITDAGI